MNFCFGRGSIPRRVWRAGAPPFLARKSGGHCTHPTGGPSFALNIKNCTDEAQKAETVLSAVSYIYIVFLYGFYVPFDKTKVMSKKLVLSWLV